MREPHQVLVGVASMRPRLITAENVDQRGGQRHRQDASMRPRLITAENAGRTIPRRGPGAGFNEAAAHHRGERGRRSARPRPETGASMRPRLITAENLRLGYNLL